MSAASTDRPPSPQIYRQWRSAAAITAAAAALLCLAWTLTYRHVAPDMNRIAAQNQRLESDLKSAVRRLASAQDHAAVTERQADVLRQANSLLRESELNRQAELTLLRADLEFYRRLGGASGSQPALAVHHIERLPTQSERVHRLIFTLTQNLRWASLAEGHVKLRLEGTRANRPDSLGWRELSPSADQALAFNFKYFQQLEFMVTLPDGFNPIRLVVELRADILKKPLEQSFEWAALGPAPGTRAGMPAAAND
jgi:hypothetical protein